MRTWPALALTIPLVFSTPVIAASTPVDGAAAPEFKLQDQNGDWHSLSQYHGQWVVLYFYPKDGTSGCTTEACTFRDDILKLRKSGAQVLGVSEDDVQSHAEFAAKYHLPFPILADDQHQAAGDYGVLSSFLFFHFARRETFLIDPQGRIARHYPDVDPKANSGQVLADLATLQTPVAKP